ncbi:MAG: sporulation protein YqfD [Eubacteriales bacterium]|nr:sporulation protein YqfD [Eubacteriales bacterium]
MVRLFRWLCGYVVFSFSKGYIEGFINSCYESGVAIRDIRRQDKTVLTGQCSPTAYMRLHRIARQNGGVVSVISKHGPIFYILRLLNRPGLLVGGFLFVWIISFFSGFVWNVEVVGNGEITDAQIISFLQDNDFGVGTYWRSADRPQLENLMMASFDKCAWVHINRDGTTARVEINETVDSPSVVDTDIVTNLKAVKDGIIVKATVYDGFKVANVGDSVVQGDLLVSGVYESEDTKRNVFAHARGEYIAQVKDDFLLVVNRQQSVRRYDDTKRYRTLCFFGINIPLYIGSSYRINSEDSYDSDYIDIDGKQLPIGIVTKTVRPYTVTTRVLTDKELTALIQQEINRQLDRDYGDCQIISQDIDIELGADSGRAVGVIQSLQNIGREYKLK